MGFNRRPPQLVTGKAFRHAARHLRREWITTIRRKFGISGEKSPPFGIHTRTSVQAIAVVWRGDTPACEVRGSTARGGLPWRLARQGIRGGSGFYGLEVRFNAIAGHVTKGEPSSGHLRRNVAGRRGEGPMRTRRRRVATASRRASRRSCGVVYGCGYSACVYNSARSISRWGSGVDLRRGPSNFPVG